MLQLNAVERHTRNERTDDSRNIHNLGKSRVEKRDHDREYEDNLGILSGELGAVNLLDPPRNHEDTHGAGDDKEAHLNQNGDSD